MNNCSLLEVNMMWGDTSRVNQLADHCILGSPPSIILNTCKLSSFPFCRVRCLLLIKFQINAICQFLVLESEVFRGMDVLENESDCLE